MNKFGNTAEEESSEEIEQEIQKFKKSIEDSDFFKTIKSLKEKKLINCVFDAMSIENKEKIGYFIHFNET